LTAVFASWGLSALAFQAQFDEVLPKLAVVHDSRLQREQLHSCMLRGFIGHPQNRRNEKPRTQGVALSEPELIAWVLLQKILCA
jgi:hypothetical protein